MLKACVRSFGHKLKQNFLHLESYFLLTVDVLTCDNKWWSELQLWAYFLKKS